MYRSDVATRQCCYYIAATGHWYKSTIWIEIGMTNGLKYAKCFAGSMDVVDKVRITSIKALRNVARYDVFE